MQWGVLEAHHSLGRFGCWSISWASPAGFPVLDFLNFLHLVFAAFPRKSSVFRMVFDSFRSPVVFRSVMAPSPSRCTLFFHVHAEGCLG